MRSRAKRPSALPVCFRQQTIKPDNTCPLGRGFDQRDPHALQWPHLAELGHQREGRIGGCFHSRLEGRAMMPNRPPLVSLLGNATA